MPEQPEQNKTARQKTVWHLLWILPSVAVVLCVLGFVAKPTARYYRQVGYEISKAVEAVPSSSNARASNRALLRALEKLESQGFVEGWHNGWLRSNAARIRAKAAKTEAEAKAAPGGRLATAEATARAQEKAMQTVLAKYPAYNEGAAPFLRDLRGWPKGLWILSGGVLGLWLILLFFLYWYRHVAVVGLRGVFGVGKHLRGLVNEAKGDASGDKDNSQC